MNRLFKRKKKIMFNKLFNKYSNTLLIVFLFTFFFLLTGCSKMDEYKDKFVKADLVYPARPDTVIVFSGNKRVMVNSIQSSDPNIVKAIIYWDNRLDSVSVDITRVIGVDTIRKIISNLQEGSHTFEIVNIDNSNNRSVSTFAIGTVYGDMFQASLINRPVQRTYLDTGLNVHLVFGGLDLSAGPIFSEIHYLKNTGDSNVVKLSISQNDTTLNDMKKGSEIIYRTFYKPDSLSLDSFHTDFESYRPNISAQWVDVTKKFVTNSGNPFAYSKWDGSRWGILKDWTTTSNVLNAGSFGGYEVKGSNSLLAMEAGWGKAAISNGKIYQNINLPYAGKWRFSVKLNDLNNVGTKYIVASTSGMPDISNVSTQSMAKLEFSANKGGDVINIEFTIGTPQTVSLGFVVNLPDNGSFFECNYTSLEYYYN